MVKIEITSASEGTIEHYAEPGVWKPSTRSRGIQGEDMNDDIRIWEINDSSKAATLVETTNRMETENALEELLVRNPDMLMQGLTLVGRQTPTDSGYLDLLGVDADGRLVVFELKREKLTRDAVAQIIDYCSHLESLAETDLAQYIANYSGRNDIDEIDDFENWYGDRQGKQLISLRPTRMVLVGLGADAQAQRMVEFLTEKGVDISLLTFRGYKYGDRMLLARQVERGAEVRDNAPRRSRSDAERRNALAERARELGMDDLWQDAVKALSIPFSSTATESGITFHLPKITLPNNVSVSGSHSVVIDPSGVICVTFYPGAVDVCLKKFEDKRGTIPFEFKKPPNAPPTKQVSEQWYCRLDKSTWEMHKPALIALAKDVHDAWQERRRGGIEA